MHRERKLAALRRALQDEGSVRGNEASFFCKNPKGCDGQHHKRKLSVNIETDVFHCWVCGYAGRSLARILQRLGPDDKDFIDYLAEHVDQGGKPSKEYEAVKLPKEFRALSDDSSSIYHRQAIAYLGRRGITADDILTYKLGYCETGKYAERVIIPSFDEYGELNFFVGRGIWERITPPYLSGKFDKNIIFNDLLVDWRKPITLVEGPFDAIKAGTNAIPLQGKFMSQKLVEKIIAKRPRVRLALDSDAFKDAALLLEKLVVLEIDVSYVDLGSNKDPGEMSQEEFNQCLHLSRPIHTRTDLLRLQVQHSASMRHA